MWLLSHVVQTSLCSKPARRPLSTPGPFSHIIVARRIASQLTLAHDGTAVDADTRVSLLTKQRNASDITLLIGEGLLNQCVVGRAELRFIPSHSENKKKRRDWTWGDMGNQAADCVARQDPTALARLLGQRQADNALIVTQPLNALYQSNETQAMRLVTTHYKTKEAYAGSPRDLCKRVATERINGYLTTRSLSRITGHQHWLDYTWNLTARITNQLYDRKTSKLVSPYRMYRFARNVLYDKLYSQNLVWKSKKSLQSSPPPLCCLCKTNTFTTSHILCDCTHPEITYARASAFSQIYDVLNSQVIKDGNVRALLRCLVECLQGDGMEYEEWRKERRELSLDRVDSRAWVGLLPLPFLDFLSRHVNYVKIPKHVFDRDIKLSLEILMSHTIPAAHAMWTIYSEYSDCEHPPQNPLRPQQASTEPPIQCAKR